MGAGKFIYGIVKVDDEVERVSDATIERSARYNRRAVILLAAPPSEPVPHAASDENAVPYETQDDMPWTSTWTR